MTWIMIATGIAAAISALYGMLLFNFGKSKKRNSNVWFYALITLPTLIPSAYIVYKLFASFAWPLFWLSVIVFAERSAWTLTLKEAAGRDKAAWFIIIYYVPLFGWLMYRITD